MGKSSPSPPPAPDYAAAATAQGAANVDTARLQGRISNPNVYGPLGSQTVSWSPVTRVDENAYNKALTDYQGQLSKYNASGGREFIEGSDDNPGYWRQLASPISPTREMYTSTTASDQPTITQTLTPDAQATLTAQQQVQRALSGLGLMGIGTAQGVIGQPFQPNLPGIQTSMGWAGPVNQNYNMGQFGYAGAGPQGQQATGGVGYSGDINQNLDIGQFGRAGGDFWGAAPSPKGLVSERGDPNYAEAVRQMQIERGLIPAEGPDMAGRELPQAQPPRPNADIDYGMIAPQTRQKPQLGPNFDIINETRVGPNVTAGSSATGALPYAGGINQNVDLGKYGQAQGTGAGPAATGAIDRSGIAAMPVSPGMTGQQAIMSRLQPQLEQSEAALRQRLANQGLVAGGEAYNQAMAAQGQQRNDLMTQAALQGINLDVAANQQGFGQALAAGQFGNQAIGQNFQQQQAAQQAQNAAVAQNQQAALQQQQANLGAQGQQFGQGLAAGQFGNQAQAQNFAQAQAQQAARNAAVQQNQQAYFQQQQANLAAQGQQYGQNLQGSQLWNQAAGQNFAQGQTWNQAQNAAIQQNQNAYMQQQQAQLAAQNQLYNQMMQSAQFGNTAQQQSLAQQLAIRNQPLNEIAGLMSGSQIQMPQFQGYQGANVAPPPIYNAAQAQHQSAMDAYGIQQAGVNAQNAGLYGLAGAGLGLLKFSDRRLKSNIERVGTHHTGIGIYDYDIFGERQRGVMADEVEQVMPNAVATHSSGFKMVNYGML